MPMTLYFKRAKCFINDEEGTKKFLAQPGPSPQPVPFWVASTATFKQGIKDGSIVNLTPPDQMPGYKHPKPEAAEEVAAEEKLEEDVEQTEVPQAPFGSQPMTPVQPAVKIGSVRTAGGRGGK
jgi:hypothetical protein